MVLLVSVIMGFFMDFSTYIDTHIHIYMYEFIFTPMNTHTHPTLIYKQH